MERKGGSALIIDGAYLEIGLKDLSLKFKEEVSLDF